MGSNGASEFGSALENCPQFSPRSALRYMTGDSSSVIWATFLCYVGNRYGCPHDSLNVVCFPAKERGSVFSKSYAGYCPDLQIHTSPFEYSSAKWFSISRNQLFIVVGTNYSQLRSLENIFGELQFLLC